jgi:hypothetical protein
MAIICGVIERRRGKRLNGHVLAWGDSGGTRQATAASQATSDGS